MSKRKKIAKRPKPRMKSPAGSGVSRGNPYRRWTALTIGLSVLTLFIAGWTLTYYYHRDSEVDERQAKGLVAKAIDLLGGAGATDVDGRYDLGPERRRILELARRDLDEALELDATNSDALNMMGILYLERGALKQAEALFAQALELRPKSPTYLANLADTVRYAGDLDRAEELYRETLTEAPFHIQATIGLAELEMHRDKIDRAIYMLRTLVKKCPDSAYANRTLGVALDIMGDLRAGEYLEKAVELSPDSARLHHSLAVHLYRDPKRQAEALSHMRTAVQLQPHHKKFTKDLSCMEGNFRDCDGPARRTLEWLADVTTGQKPRHGEKVVNKDGTTVWVLPLPKPSDQLVPNKSLQRSENSQ